MQELNGKVNKMKMEMNDEEDEDEVLYHTVKCLLAYVQQMARHMTRFLGWAPRQLGFACEGVSASSG